MSCVNFVFFYLAAGHVVCKFGTRFDCIMIHALTLSHILSSGLYGHTKRHHSSTHNTGNDFHPATLQSKIFRVNMFCVNWMQILSCKWYVLCSIAICYAMLNKGNRSLKCSLYKSLRAWLLYLTFQPKWIWTLKIENDFRRNFNVCTKCKIQGQFFWDKCLI